MREKINHLALGDIDLISPILHIEPSYVEQFVKAGSITRIELNIETKNEIPFKTLLYSDNYRVKFLNTNLAGTNAKLVFDVDATYLEDLDIIEGKLSLVTNAGEYFIPYKFTVFSTKANKMLSELKTVEDFLYLYKEDRETALRIFEYKDFKKAPFMKNLVYLATYKAFSAKNASLSDLEEFLISIKAKERIKFSASTKDFSYKDIKNDTLVSVKISKNTYGYASLELETDSEFISLDNNRINDIEFVENEYILNFRILADKLKVGTNTAKVRLFNTYTELELNINIDNTTDIKKDITSTLEDKKRYFAYLKYRLTYEYADADEREILPELMRIELEEIKESYPHYNSIIVLIAETYFMEKNYEKVKEYIEKVATYFKTDDKLLSDEDLLIEYMQASMNEDYIKLDDLSKLVSSLTYTKDRKFIFLLNMNLREEVASSFALRYEYIIREFSRGSRSPFLYMAYINLLNQRPVFLHDIEELELLTLIFAIKNDFVSDKLLAVLKSRIKNMGDKNPLKYVFLELLFIKYKEDIYLEALCEYAIKNTIKESKLNKWFYEAIKRDINVSHVYEYYIYTLKDTKYKLEEKILVHFLGNSNIDTKYKIRIYENILRSYDKESDLYKAYINDIKRFTIVSLKTNKLDEHYAYLYKTVLSTDMLDADMLANLAHMLSAYKLKITNKNIKAVTLIYPELKKEKIYNLENEIAYIYLYSKDAIIIVSDINNNKYASFDIEIEKLFDIDKLKIDLHELYDTLGIAKLEYTKTLLAKRELSFEEVKFLEESIRSIDLSESFKQEIFVSLITYYRSNALDLANINAWDKRAYDILLSANKDLLSTEQRNMVTDAFINLGYFNEAYEMLKRYKSFHILKVNLDRLVEKMILDRVLKNDSLSIYLTTLSFINGNKSRGLLDYLCRYFNGSNKDMYSILEIAVAENVETYDLEERLLAQLLFTDDKEYIDKVFAFYISRKKVNDSLVKAYFTSKSMAYILYDDILHDNLIEYIENSIFIDAGLNKCPLVYKIAILKYYSKSKELEEIQVEYAKAILDDLISKGLEFPFYKDLSRFILVPNEILNKEYIVYIAKNKENPVLYTKLNDASFVKERFIAMYQRMYIKSVLLYEDEVLEYKICDNDIETDILYTGKIEADFKEKRLKNKFDYINKILSIEDEKALGESLKDFVVKEELSKTIFELM